MGLKARALAQPLIGGEMTDAFKGNPYLRPPGFCKLSQQENLNYFRGGGVLVVKASSPTSEGNTFPISNRHRNKWGIHVAISNSRRSIKRLL
jgi:hypothetical protein